MALPAESPSSFTVTLALNGHLRTIEAYLHTLRSPDCVVLVDRGNGMSETIEPPPVRTYRGSVAGVGDSRVAVSLVDGALAGLIDLPGEGTYFVQPASAFDPGQPPSLHVVYASTDVLPNPEVGCGNDHYDLAAPDWMLMESEPIDAVADGTEGSQAGGAGAPEGGIAGAQPQLLEIAFDADYEFYDKNGKSVAATINDIELVMNGVEFIYDRDVDIAYEFTTFVVRTSTDDPYVSFDIGDQLCEFRNQWNGLPEVDIQREVAQLYTGKSLDSTSIGLAWLGVVCNQNGNDCGGFGNLAYSTVESRFSLVLANRQALSAHELGHNWSATHCDGNGDCHIMCSLLGSCNGIAGSNLKFGDEEVDEIVGYKNAVGCDNVSPLPLSPPFLDQFLNSSIDGTKWTYVNGAATSTSATNEPSGIRSLNLDATGSDPYEDDEIRSNVILLANFPVPLVSLWTQHKGVESGEKLVIEYWTVSGDWASLGEVVSNGVDQSTFVQSAWLVPANGKHDGFRLRLRAEVDETNDDWYVDDIQVGQPANPPPPNDECGAALAVGAGSHLFDTTHATDSVETIPLSCDGFSGAAFAKDIWYLVTAPCSGNITVSTCGTAGFDTRLAVYAGGNCPTSGVQPLTCSDNFGGCAGGTSQVIFNATASSPYLVRVGGVSGGGPGVLNVTCSAVPTPPNDECNVAAFIQPGSYPFDTSTANDSVGTLPAGCNEGNGVTMRKDVWWIAMATCAGTLEVSTCNAASFDTRLALYSFVGLCPVSGAPVVACSDDDDGCGTTSVLSVPCQLNDFFLIRLGGVSGPTPGGAGTLTVTCIPSAPPCPADLSNDDVVDGADLAVVLGSWGSPGADLNGDGTTDGADLAAVLGSWGACP